MSEKKPSRRHFLGACSHVLGMAAVSPALMARTVQPVRPFERVLLTDIKQRPLDCRELVSEKEYIFHYPYAATPCFLFDLGRPIEGGKRLETQEGQPYTWKGGVGPKRSVVAFSAICAHRMTHPSPAVSFIGYRKQEVGYMDQQFELRHRAGVIQCCSERSIYDPANGAEVLGGPAEQPLAAIELEYTDDGLLYATGVYGGDLFDRYFDTFGNRLIMEYETLEIRRLAAQQSVVETIDEFTRRRMDCSA